MRGEESVFVIRTRNIDVGVLIVVHVKPSCTGPTENNQDYSFRNSDRALIPWL